jgi:hypothetical protein
MQPSDSHEPETVWKAQNEGEQIIMKPDELAALARSRENLNKFVHWAAVFVMSSLALKSLYNVWAVDEPWIRFGQAWVFGLLAYVLGTELENGVGRKGVSEPCLRFLERQHEKRARGYLRIRRRLWLLIPSIVASWLGGGPQIVARARGLGPSSWIFRFCAGPWPFIFVIVGLMLVWLAFGAAARKAMQDLEEIRGSAAG